MATKLFPKFSQGLAQDPTTRRIWFGILLALTCFATSFFLFLAPCSASNAETSFWVHMLEKGIPMMKEGKAKTVDFQIINEDQNLACSVPMGYEESPKTVIEKVAYTLTTERVPVNEKTFEAVCNMAINSAYE